MIEFVDVFVSQVVWWLQLAGGCQYDWETTATFPMNVSHTGIPKPATNCQQAKSHAQPDQEKHIKFNYDKFLVSNVIIQHSFINCTRIPKQHHSQQDANW